MRVGGQVGTGERGTVDAVLAGGRADDEHRIARPPRRGAHRLACLDDTGGHGIDQNIVVVAGHEVHFAADGGYAKTVAVVADALDHAGDEVFHPVSGRRTETQAVERGDGSGAHGKNIAVNAAHAGRRALVGLDGRGVVMAFDLEHTAQSVANVHQPGVFFARCHQ